MSGSEAQEPYWVQVLRRLWDTTPSNQVDLALALVVIVILAVLVGWPVYRKLRRTNAFDDKIGSLRAEEAHAKETDKKNAGKPPVVVAIASFARTPRDGELMADQALSLVDRFQGRFIKNPSLWENDIWPALERLFKDVRGLGRPVHLRLDAHSTIAFACGALFDVKTGLPLELEQRGDRGVEVWLPTAGREERALPGLQVISEDVGEGADVAVALSVSRAVGADVRTFVTHSLPQVGRLVMIVVDGGPGQGKVIDGAHAAHIADAVAADINDIRGAMKGGAIHLFASCPNSLMVALGRRSLSFGRVHLYEFDFQRERSGTYLPSMGVGHVLEAV